MRKLWIIGGVLALIVVVVVILVINLEGIVNRNKDFFISRAEESLGRDITVGEIGVTVWGGLGVRVEDFSVADDPRFSSEPFVVAQNLQVSARLLPLLRKDFQIKSITLNEPIIRIIRDEQGVLNTGQAVPEPRPGSAPSRPAPDGDAAPSGSETSSQGAALVISLVNINNGELHYTDRTQDLKLHIRHIDSNVEGIESSKPISLDVKAAVFGDTHDVRVKGTLGPIGAGADMTAAPVSVRLSLDGVAIETVTATMPQLRAALPADLALAGPASVEADVSGTLAKLRVTGTINGTEITISKVNAFSKAAGTPLALTADVTYSPDQLSIESASLRLHELKARGSGTYKLGDRPVMDLAVETEETPLAGWGQLLPAAEQYGLSGTMKFQGTVTGGTGKGDVPNIKGAAWINEGTAALPQLLQPLSAVNANITFVGDGAEFKDATVTLGSSKLRASGRITQFAPFALTYTTSSDAIAMDDLRPPNPKAKKPEVLRNAKAEGTITAAVVPRHTGTVTSGGGSIANLDYQNLSGRYDIVGKEAKLSDVHVQTLDGTITGAGTILMDEKSPSFNFNAVIRDADVVQVVDLIPGAARKLMNGKVNLELNVSGSGKEWANIQQTISGTGLAEIFDGALLDINIIQGVLDRLGEGTGRSNWVSSNLKNKYPTVFNIKDTKFENFKSDFIIEDGKLKARNVALDAGKYTLAGKGFVGLDKTVDLQVNMVLSQAFSVDLMNDVAEAKYLVNSRGLIEVPFVLTGTLPGVKAGISPDFISNVIQRALMQEGTKKIESKLLDTIFGKKKKPAPADTTGSGG